MSILVLDVLLWSVLPLSNTLMSKQDAVAPGLRVHLHQQGFIWGLRGVLISTGRKRLFFGGVLNLGPGLVCRGRYFFIIKSKL